MSNYNQHQAPRLSAPPAQYTNPPLAPSYPVHAMHTSAYTTPPPAGHPTKDAVHSQQQVPAETTSRGDGFWKGCCAALCCCCLVDMCF